MNITGSTAAAIFDSIRREVHTQRLRAGEALPTVRELAARLGVNRNTVAAAYRRLVASGIAVTQGRNGTVIRGAPPALAKEGTPVGSSLLDLAGGNPDPACLPDPLAALAGGDYRPTLYGAPAIDPELAALARRWLLPGPAQVTHAPLTLTHGAVDAIERLLAAYLMPGDLVALEDPCFLGSLNTLRCAGLRALPVAIDAEGMRPEALEAALAAGAQAVLCTPRAHNPTGCSLGASRAKALRAILARHPHVLVIEDDHFALLARTPYFSIVPAGACRWALVRSVSKALGPDLRLALVASDAGTAERLHLRLVAGTAWVSHLLQTAVRRLLGNDAVLAQLRAASDTYARRRQALIDALREVDIAALEPCEGLNVWVPLPPDTDAAHLAQRLAQAGWLVRTAEAFAIAAPRPALRLTASTLEPATAAHFARQLAEQLGAVRRRR